MKKNPLIWMEETNILADLPLDLKYLIIMNINKGALKQINFFADCQDKFFVISFAHLI